MTTEELTKSIIDELNLINKMQIEIWIKFINLILKPHALSLMRILAYYYQDKLKKRWQ